MAASLTPIAGAPAWTGPEQASRCDWVYPLSGADVAELEAALSTAKRSGKSRREIGRSDFPLPNLPARVAQWLDELQNGRGFALIRGIPTEGKSVEDCALLYWGLGTHLGSPVSQNAAGDLLGHVRDVGANPDDPAVRLYKTRERLGFHTDGADLIGLLCLRTGRSGGASRITSSAAVYNEVLRRRPDLAPLLFEPFPFDRNEEQAEGEPPYFELPLCFRDGDRLQMFYIGWYIRDSQRHPEAPRLSDAQRELIDLIDEIAESPDFYLEMDFRPGDIQLLQNSAILHARTEYQDFEEPERKRHLLRLWLNGNRPSQGDAAVLQGGIPQKEGAVSDADL